MKPHPRDQMEAEDWMQDGAFLGFDGRPVRCYDDVVIARAIPVDGGVRTEVSEVPAGTVGTVLFYSTGPVGMAQLECSVGEGAFALWLRKTIAAEAAYDERREIPPLMLSISNLHVAVGDKPILKGLALDVPAGEAPAVMGRNGVGKSMPWYAAGRRRS